MSNALTVTLFGSKKMDVSDQLISLLVTRELNKIPEAKLVFSTGNFSERQYPLFEEVDFQIGAALDVKIRYEGSGSSDESIFKGIVTKIKFESMNGMPVLAMGISDPAFRLVDSVNTAFYKKKNDKQIIETVLAAQTGVSLVKSAASLTSFSFDQFIKKQVSDWFFIVERAAAHGLFIQLNNGAMQVLELSDTQGAIDLEIGIDAVLGVDLTEDATDLNQQITIGYWDVKQNTLMTVQQNSSSTLAKAVKASSANYVFLGISDKNEAEALLNYFVVAEQQSVLKGWIEIPGKAAIDVMQQLNLSSFPTAYNGSYTISKVTQNVRFGTWTTRIEVGNTALPILNSFQVTERLSVAVKTIETATVLKWEKDPENLGRIPIQVLAFGSDTYWAYPGQVSAGSKQSSYVLPEEGEIVIVGFLHNNYSQGVLLTSSYLSANQPPAPFKLAADTPTGFVSQKGLKFIFDDAEKEITGSTSDSNKIELHDSNGIRIDSKKDFTTTSSGNSSIKANTTVSVKGTTINLN